MPSHHSCTVATVNGKPQLVVLREPFWTAVLLAGAEMICVATRHRLCMSLVKSAFGLSERHAERFVLDCSDELVAAYDRWQGWADDESEDEVP